MTPHGMRLVFFQAIYLVLLFGCATTSEPSIVRMDSTPYIVVNDVRLPDADHEPFAQHSHVPQLVPRSRF